MSNGKCQRVAEKVEFYEGWMKVQSGNILVAAVRCDEHRCDEDRCEDASSPDFWRRFEAAHDAAANRRAEYRAWHDAYSALVAEHGWSVTPPPMPTFAREHGWRRVKRPSAAQPRCR